MQMHGIGWRRGSIVLCPNPYDSLGFEVGEGNMILLSLNPSVQVPKPWCSPVHCHAYEPDLPCACHAYNPLLVILGLAKHDESQPIFFLIHESPDEGEGYPLPCRENLPCTIPHEESSPHLLLFLRELIKKFTVNIANIYTSV